MPYWQYRVIYEHIIFNNRRIGQHTKTFYTSFNSVYWPLSNEPSLVQQIHVASMLLVSWRSMTHCYFLCAVYIRPKHWLTASLVLLFVNYTTPPHCSTIPTIWTKNSLLPVTLVLRPFAYRKDNYPSKCAWAKTSIWQV